MYSTNDSMKIEVNFLFAFFLLLLCFVPILQCPDRILLLLLALSLSRYNQTKFYYVALIFEALNSKNSIQKRHIELMVCALAWMDFAHTRTLYRHIFFCFFVSVRPPNIQCDGCCFMANTHTPFASIWVRFMDR